MRSIRGRWFNFTYWAYSQIKSGGGREVPYITHKTSKRRALACKTYSEGSVTHFGRKCDSFLRLRSTEPRIFTGRYHSTYIFTLLFVRTEVSSIYRDVCGNQDKSGIYIIVQYLQRLPIQSPPGTHLDWSRWCYYWRVPAQDFLWALILWYVAKNLFRS